jgi:serine/threonine protein kinase
VSALFSEGSVARRHLGEPEPQHLFGQLWLAVDYLHSELEAVHRDLKLANIVMTARDRVKLIDSEFSNRTG